MQAGDELAVAGVERDADGLADLEHARGEVVGRVGGRRGVVAVSAAAGEGEQREQRGEARREEGAGDVHGASPASGRAGPRRPARGDDVACWGG